MQEFLELQTKRRLQSHETIVEYMYSKNAILNKAPYRLAEEERISLILSGIEDDTWANPLAAQLCGTVTELIDRAALLDARRRMTVCADNDEKPPPSTTSRGQGSSQRDVLIVWTDAHQAIVNAVKHYRAEIKRVPHAAGKINQKIVNVEQLRRHKEPLLEVTEPSPPNDTCA
ncbi:hypothetical protein HPB52_023554 [Rhipicephalus sanguineus]|uniref:Uncharacterized protein n=1 Tax=Rhipicephalus sanguineus TaxID=34632 RepID=A0A9D4PHB6_RHISA|nr:hypothetical protein HPB52_023554 [Rhipicephalus sanguineus]